jgi:hypothetical protein
MCHSEATIFRCQRNRCWFRGLGRAVEAAGRIVCEPHRGSFISAACACQRVDRPRRTGAAVRVAGVVVVHSTLSLVRRGEQFHREQQPKAALRGGRLPVLASERFHLSGLRCLRGQAAQLLVRLCFACAHLHSLTGLLLFRRQSCAFQNDGAKHQCPNQAAMYNLVLGLLVVAVGVLLLACALTAADSFKRLPEWGGRAPVGLFLLHLAAIGMWHALPAPRRPPNLIFCSFFSLLL